MVVFFCFDFLFFEGGTGADFSWLFCETRAIFGLIDTLQRNVQKLFWMWVHCYKVKQFCFIVVDSMCLVTWGIKRSNSKVVALPPEASVDLGFALGKTEYLKGLFLFSPDDWSSFFQTSFYFLHLLPLLKEREMKGAGWEGRGSNILLSLCFVVSSSCIIVFLSPNDCPVK